MSIRNIASRPKGLAFAATAASLLSLAGSVTRAAAAGPAFEKIANYAGAGTPLSPQLGWKPYSTTGEWLYISYLYQNGPIEVLAIDPNTLQTIPFKCDVASSETGARCMVRFKDSSALFLGTLPNAHFLKLDTETGTYTDLGKAPSKTYTEETTNKDGIKEEKVVEVHPGFVWGMARGSDGMLYGGTSALGGDEQVAALIMCNPQTSQMVNLGYPFSTESLPSSPNAMIHSVAAGAGEDSHYIYMGLGASTPMFVAYDINRKEWVPISGAQAAPVGVNANVWNGDDGNVYGGIDKNYYQLIGTQAIALAAPKWSNVKDSNGRSLSVENPDPPKADYIENYNKYLKSTVSSLDAAGKSTNITTYSPFSYVGEVLGLARVGIGPDGTTPNGTTLYASSILPSYLLKLDASSPSQAIFSRCDVLGEGEVYGFLSQGQRLLTSLYSGGNALLKTYDPKNQAITSVTGDIGDYIVASWRPYSLITGPDGLAYTAGMPGYGLPAGGPLVAWNVGTGATTLYGTLLDPLAKKSIALIPGESITTLATWQNLIVGGTTIRSNNDQVHPTQTKAALFLFDPSTGHVENIAYPGQGIFAFDCLNITSDGIGYVFANVYLDPVKKTTATYLLSFNVSDLTVRQYLRLSFSQAAYNSMALGPDGNLWGLLRTNSRSGIFKIHPTSGNVTVVAWAPELITGGFAIQSNSIYYVAGTQLYRYNIPMPAKADILWRDTFSGNVSFWFMDGTPSSSPGGAMLVNQIAGIGDFDGDGKSDILWRNTSNGEVSIWFMDGTTFKYSGSPGGAMLINQIAGVADFNGDGKADILWRNTSTGELYIWLMDGATLKYSATPGGAMLVNQIAGIADFNGDGSPDILFRNTSTGEVSIWFMDGTTRVSSGSPGSNGTENQIAGIADFDGDGRPDILWRNTSTGEISIWFMDGQTLKSSGSPGGAALVNQIAAIGDFNGDGKADILFKNTSTGLVSIWYMNGATRLSSGSPGTANQNMQVAGIGAF
jgi:hypothetical protein